MQKLEISVKQTGTSEELVSNIRSALERKLPEVTPALCCNDGTFVVVGSGPSLPQFLQEIAAERAAGRPICSVNGAHDFLCGKGIDPDLFVSLDPRDTIIGNTQKKNQNTIYLIASRCSPNLFDHLADCHVVRWHAWSIEKDEAEAIRGHMGIGGGTTSGLRAIQIGYVLGFRKFVIYGLDSCLAEDGITKRFSGERAGKTVPVTVGEGGPTFICNMAMAQQANEAQLLCQVMPDATFDFRGPGLLAAIWEERRRRGLQG